MHCISGTTVGGSVWGRPFFIKMVSGPEANENLNAIKQTFNLAQTDGDNNIDAPCMASSGTNDC